MKRRIFLASLPINGAAMATAQVQDADQQEASEDIVIREMDIQPFFDGVVCRENDQQTAIPMIRPATDFDYVTAGQLRMTSDEMGWNPPTFPMLSLFSDEQTQAVAFNFYLPAENDTKLFVSEPETESPLVITRDPGLVLASKSNQRASNTSDGTIRQKWDKVAFRFEAHGIIRKDLNPTCVPGAKEGIWIKFDLPGIDSFNPFDWDRWHTFAEGSLASIQGQAGQYQFHWTKPKICSTGSSERNAVYNGVLKMIQDLVKEVLGSVGKYLDDLLKLSTTIAAFIADTLTKWIRSTSTPSGGSGPTPAPVGSFTLTATPSSATVKRGSSVSYRIQVTPTNGFTGRVKLSASGRTGSSVSFSPSSVSAGGQSTFTVRTSRTSTVKNHVIKVTGTGGPVSREVNLNLSILA